MIKTKRKTYETEVVTDVICNVCGRKLETDTHGYYEDFLHIEKQWGYTSKKDGETENIDICEDCWDKLKRTFKIKP